MDGIDRDGIGGEDPPKILFVSAGIWHPNLLARQVLWKTILQPPNTGMQWVVESTSSMETLPGSDYPRYRGIVLYFHHKTISDAALRAFQAYVAGGGGVLAVHSAAASFKNQAEYYAILGGRFTGHGPVTEFEIVPDQRAGALLGDLSAFVVTDELYRHEYDLANRVHLYTEIDGMREPVLWTRHYERGRVCYCSLGHTAGALRHPQTRLALERGLAWATGVITLPEVQP